MGSGSDSILKKMTIQLAALWANPHTRYAGLIYFFAKVSIQVMEVWFQSYSQQLRATAEIIEAAAVLYGLNAAGAGNATLTQTGEDLKLRKAEKELDNAQVS